MTNKNLLNKRKGSLYQEFTLPQGMLPFLFPNSVNTLGQILLQVILVLPSSCCTMDLSETRFCPVISTIHHTPLCQA